MPIRKLLWLPLLCLVVAFTFPAIASGRYDASQLSGVSIEEIDGGPGYYGRFADSLPTDPSYFPIGTWLMPVLDQHQIDLDRAAGLNLYVGVSDPEGSDLALLRSNGMKALVQADERTRFTGIGSETAGWLLADEIDMSGGPGACNGSLETIKNGLPADGRARYNNYGKGVLLWHSDAEAACFIEAQQLVSSDLYWFTDPNQADMVGESWLPEGERPLTLDEVRRAANYGYQVDRIRALDARDGQRKPIWNFIEVGWPWTETAAQGGRAILPAEIRAAVWHSLIAGARGILYFDHQFNGPCTDDVLRGSCYPANLAMVRSVNEQIRQLAPVLNAPSVRSGWTANDPIRALVKWHSGHLYVFAGSRNNVASTGTISFPCVGEATATRLGEAGSVPVSGGSFSDGFTDGNTVHIYRIDGGSTCGLPTPEPPSTLISRPTPLVPHIGRLPRRVSLRSGRLRVPVTCAASCTVRSRLTTSSWRLRRAGASRRVVLGTARRRFGPGRHVVVIRLSRRTRRMLARRRRPLVMRLHTVIVEPGKRVQRTQRLIARRFPAVP